MAALSRGKARLRWWAVESGRCNGALAGRPTSDGKPSGELDAE
jgi:hypothetical protein